MAISVLQSVDPSKLPVYLREFEALKACIQEVISGRRPGRKNQSGEALEVSCRLHADRHQLEKLQACQFPGRLEVTYRHTREVGGSFLEEIRHYTANRGEPIQVLEMATAETGPLALRHFQLEPDNLDLLSLSEEDLVPAA